MNDRDDRDQQREPEQPLHDDEIRTLDESDMKVIKGSWGCSITWNHRSVGGGLGGGGMLDPLGRG
ncbi:MAG: hypothetical protein IPM29_15985 [Planctomycetes bacterium]|nr:hypothetical protein [Planctomycetota bacterium]